MKKYDMCEMNFQINQLREVSEKFLVMAGAREFSPKDEKLTALALKNKIRVGQLAELLIVLNKAHALAALIREYLIDDLEVQK